MTPLYLIVIALCDILRQLATNKHAAVARVDEEEFGCFIIAHYAVGHLTLGTLEGKKHLIKV